MKKILSLLLVILLMFSTSAFAVNVTAQTTEQTTEDTAVQTDVELIGDYLYFEGECEKFGYRIENGEVTVFGNDNTSGVIEIPATIAGYPVKHIDGFANCYVPEMIIPDGVETIADMAFYRTSMKKIVLPDSIKSLGYDLFDQCPDIEYETVWVKYTPEGATITKTYTMRYIGNYLISGMFGAPTVCQIPEGTLGIMGEAFSNVSDSFYTGIYIPASVVDIGDRAFVNCEANEAFTVSEDNLYYSSDEHGVLYNKDKTVLISYPRANAATHFTVPETVKRIEPYAFNNCAILESVTVSEGVESIGRYAFSGCTSLVDIELPDSMCEIEFKAFEETGYYLDENNWENDILYIGKHLIEFRDVYPSEVTAIKDGTVTIAEYALSYFPNPLSIPESVRGLGDTAFASCAVTENVTISENLVFIGERAFNKTETVKRFEVDENNPNYSSDEYGVLFNKDKTVLIDYPEASELTEYTIPASVETITEHAFNGCQNLKYIDFEEDTAITILGISAFQQCLSLEGISLPETLYEIGNHAFANCENLKSISIPENVIKIKGSAFNTCKKLETVKFAENSKLRFLGTSVFSWCLSLKEIELPEGVKKIRRDLFRTCNKLETVIIRAADLERIENGAFYYQMDKLETVIFYGTQEQWDNVKIYNYNDKLAFIDIVCDPDNNGFTYTFVYRGKEYKRNFKYGEPVVIPEEIDLYAVTSWWGDPIPETMPRKNLTSNANVKGTVKSENYDVSAYYNTNAFTTTDVSLSVAEIQGDREPGGIYMVEGEYYEQVGLFNIKMLNRYSNVIQPLDGYTVTIRLALPEAYKNRTSFVIYHRFTGGGREQLSTEKGTVRVENGYLIFDVSSFSEFEVLAVTPQIKVTGLPHKTVYAYGEDIDLSGIILVYNDKNGNSKVISNTSLLTVRDYDSTKTGKQTVTVSYGQYSDTFEVEVKLTFWQWILRIIFFGFILK